MTYNTKEFLNYMLNPSCFHSVLMDHDKEYAEGFRKYLLDKYPEVFNKNKENE